jgi:hypothetical protein
MTYFEVSIVIFVLSPILQILRIRVSIQIQYSYIMP